MEEAAAQAPPWTKSPQGRDRLSAARNAVKTLVQEQRLNPSQAAAVTAALTRTVTLWQGPPGTGKVSRKVAHSPLIHLLTQARVVMSGRLPFPRLATDMAGRHTGTHDWKGWYCSLTGRALVAAGCLHACCRGKAPTCNTVPIMHVITIANQVRNI
jgi:1,6-anhydro-N-acetylmuramate kinase